LIRRNSIKILTQEQDLAIFQDIMWHDLPLESFSIQMESVKFLITPFDDKNDCYLKYEFVLTNFSNISFSINSEANLKFLSELEIFNFDYTLLDENKLSGKIGILPGNSGYWEVAFENATWQLIPIN